MNEQQAWQLAPWDAVETADRVRRKEVSASDVIDAALIRLQRAERLNAVVTLTADRARAQASRGSTGPFGVVPTFIKDLHNLEGVRTTWGSAATGHFISPKSDDNVRAVESLGLVPLGKSAAPEFGLTGTTEPLTFGPCHNPWDETRSPGGSSGGAAALVASGVVPIAHASDGGGSIRIPAACCGLVGLKPSRGRLDLEGSGALPVRAIVHGVVSRTVRDTVAFWDGIERVRFTDLPPIGGARLAPAKRLRIGFSAESPWGSPVDAEVKATLERTAKVCESLGHHVELRPSPFTRADLDDFASLWAFFGFMESRLGRFITHRNFDPTRLEPWTLALTAHFEATRVKHLVRIARMRRFDRVWPERLKPFDVFLTPTIATLPPKLGHLRTDVGFDEMVDRVGSTFPFTSLFNASGAPAVSLPLGQSATGVPIGVQVGGAWGSERLLLELAAELEGAMPWPKTARGFDPS